MDLLIAAALVLTGLVAGVASGMFGIGGGILVVPALLLLGLLEFREAVAASLLYMTFTTPIGIWRHWRAGNVLPRTGALLAASGLAGVIAGQAVAPYVTDHALVLGFALLLVVAAHNLAYGALPTKHHASVPLILAVGVTGGFVAKLFGIGGGIVMVPAMAFTGIVIHAAVGTSLVVVLTNAVFASILNLLAGGSWMIWAVPVALGGVVGVPLGVQRVLRMQGDRLRRLFAILLVAVALQLVRGAV
ncbi:MAG TPA: sulfite exporter TauE/SafE family protein [Candidatus Thermoplasmatota archaeon]|nr:sulfite exporter TauE/SafE family protein [Candidatus Thermoplasmatota archaeon]